MTIRFNKKAGILKVGVGDLLKYLNQSPISHEGNSMFAAYWGREYHEKFSKAPMNGRLSEVHVSHQLKVAQYTAIISGRIDLMYVGEGKTVVQEIKTLALHASQLEHTSEDDFPAFCEQLRIYLYLLECSEQYKNVQGRLLVVSILDGTVKEIAVTYEPEAVFLLVRAALLKILHEHELAAQKLEYRRSFPGHIQFPYRKLRKYQEEAVAAVSDALEARNNLLLSSPTGTGKTASVLTAAVRFALAHDLRIFWASGKGTHQKMVADTLRLLLPKEAPLTIIFLMAKEKLCLNDVYICEEHCCPYSVEFSAKLRDNRSMDLLLQQQIIMPEDVVQAATETKVCPFELSREIALKADVVAGDYNYIFDPRVSLRRLFPRKRKDWILIVDEAHNLCSRARGYFSPSLVLGDIKQAERIAAAAGWCPPGVPSLLREIIDYVDDIRSKNRTERKLAVEFDRDFFKRIGRNIQSLTADYFLARLRLDQPPEQSEDILAESLLSIIGFCSIMGMEGDFADIYDATDGSIKLLCLDPSRQLGEIIRSFFSVIAISATLEPHDFFRDVLGFPADETMACSFPSPFHREMRKVLIVPAIGTTFRGRATTVHEVARLLREVTGVRAGNYAVFFPSFAYLQLVPPHLADFPGRLLVQKESMTGGEIKSLLDNLQDRSQLNLVLGVQSGSLAEGIDYSGRSLAGVFIIGVGLPELSFENDLLKRHFDEKYGAGFQYAYLYPGMIRVIQSAGRVIRSEEDAGFIILVGKQYASSAYNSLLPREWYEYSVDELFTAEPVNEIRRFWNSF